MWAKIGRIAPLQSVEAVFRDFGEKPEQAAGGGNQDTLAESMSAPALDRRSSESLIGRDRVIAAGRDIGPAGAAALAAGRKDAQRQDPQAGTVVAKSPSKDLDAQGLQKPSRNEIEDRLAQLEAEKGARERGKTSAAAGRNAEQAAVISQLKARDGEVKAHEAAHIAAGGSYITGGASYSYQRGPDGASYAIGGEVGIDSSPIPGKPEETIAKMTIVRAAALAPADPSGADLSVAGAAAQAMSQAMADMADERAQAATRGPSAEAMASQGNAASSPKVPNDPFDQGRKSEPGSKIDLVA
jgi:hypothetical protein